MTFIFVKFLISLLGGEPKQSPSLKMMPSVALFLLVVFSVMSVVDWTIGVNQDWDPAGPNIKPMGAETFYFHANSQIQSFWDEKRTCPLT